MIITTEAAHALHNYLQGEFAAVETYEIAMEKFDGYSKELLYQIMVEHQDHCNILEQYIQSQNGHSKLSSGLWEVWTQLSELTARIIGKIPTLRALRDGEAYGIRHYRESLENVHIPGEVRDMIEREIIPSIERHVMALDDLMDKHKN